MNLDWCGVTAGGNQSRRQVMGVDAELSGGCRDPPAGGEGGTKVSHEENTLEAFFFDVWKLL